MSNVKNQQKYWVKDTTKSQETLQVGVHGHHTRFFSKSLTKDTTFANDLLIVDSYFKLTILYGIENNTTEEVMDKLYIFKSIFGKLDGFDWWDLEKIKTDTGIQFHPSSSKKVFLYVDYYLY